MEIEYDRYIVSVAENHQGDQKRPNRAGRGRKTVAMAALLLLITVLFYWKLTLTRQYTWLDSTDLAWQVLPWFQFQAREVHAGRAPLWDPHHWGGQSLIGQAQPGTAYPLNWLLFSLPLRDGQIRMGFLTWYFVVIHWMAAWFCYLLCRDLRRSRPASVFAACVFTFGGWLGNASWPQMMNSAVWTPLVFLFVLRAARGRRPYTNAAAAGLVSGFAWLGGHHQIPIYTALAAAAVWVYFIFRGGRPNWRMARLAVVWIAFTALAGGLQILPAWEYGRMARRWVSAPSPVTWNEAVPYSVHSEYSLGGWSLLGIVFPGLYRHSSPFAGWAAVSLAALGVWAAWRKRTVRVFFAVALGGLLFALGRDSLFHGIAYALIPLVEKARTPAVASFIFNFGLCILSAYGMDRLHNAAVRRIGWVAMVAACAALTVGFSVALVNKLQLTFDDRILVSAFMGLLAGGTFIAAGRGVLTLRTAAVFLIAIALVEFGYTVGETRDRRTATSLQHFDQAPEIVQFLRQQPGWFRVQVDNEVIPYNFGNWHGFHDIGGYMASVQENIWQVGAVVPSREVLYGLLYRVTKKPPEPGETQVFEAPGGFKVYRKPDPLPRVWTVHHAVQHPEKRWLPEGFDLRTTAFLHEPPPALATCDGADTARILEYNSGRVLIEANMACAGMLVLSDNNAPGWRAAVDGRSTRIVPAYGSLRGVIVPAGAHRIQFRYRPWSVYLGGAFTLLGIAGFAAIRVFERRRAQA